MSKQRMDIGKIIVILVCITVIALGLIASVFSAEVILNKKTRATYNKITDTDKKMLQTLDSYLTNEDGTRKTFDKPIAFVKNNSVFRGRAYVFNVPLTEHKLNYGLSGGTYSTEIILPDEMDLPTMYRCSTFAPNLGSLLFPSDYKQVKLCEKDVYVISYNDSMLEDGSFTTLLDRVFGEK